MVRRSPHCSEDRHTPDDSSMLDSLSRLFVAQAMSNHKYFLMSDNHQSSMTISAGTRLGPYEIVAPIGAGGMGEVYKARDTRLDRAVAVKILPAEFASNAELRVRFEREARTISQLSH